MLFCKETLGKPQNKPEKSLSTVWLGNTSVSSSESWKHWQEEEGLLISA